MIIIEIGTTLSGVKYGVVEVVVNNVYNSITQAAGSITLPMSHKLLFCMYALSPKPSQQLPADVV